MDSKGALLAGEGPSSRLFAGLAYLDLNLFTLFAPLFWGGKASIEKFSVVDKEVLRGFKK